MDLRSVYYNTILYNCRDTAYTNVAIEPHTDGNYFHDPPGQ